IAGLEARRTSPARLLDGLAMAASPHLWLTEVTLAEGRLRLTGFATDERTITDFLDRLRDTGALAALDLEEAGRDDRATPPARRFVVAGRVGEERGPSTCVGCRRAIARRSSCSPSRSSSARTGCASPARAPPRFGRRGIDWPGGSSISPPRGGRSRRGSTRSRRCVPRRAHCATPRCACPTG